jgi:hypothetical protein
MSFGEMQVSGGRLQLISSFVHPSQRFISIEKLVRCRLLLRAGDLQSVRTCLMAAAAAAASSLHFITIGIGDNLNILPILVCAPGCRVSYSEVR